MELLIYLASPYSSEFADITERRVRQVESAAAHLIEKGHLIFSPIVHSHPIADQVSFSSQNVPGAMSPWMKYDHAMIDKSDELWVLMLPEWEKSLGVANEIEYALSQGKTVRYIEYPTFRETEHIKAQDGLHYPIIAGNETGVPFFTSRSDTTYHDSIPQADGDNGEFFKRPSISGSFEFRKVFDYEALRRERPDLFEVDPSHNFDCKVCEKTVEVTTVTCGDCSKAITGEYGRIVHLDNAPHTQSVSMPDEAGERESYPMAEGLLYYFPNALAEVSKISKIGNDQHNPGEPMHWARGKSLNHADKIIRHLIDAGKKDSKGNRHSAFMAWRALALLQVELEQTLNLPLPKNAKDAEATQ